MSSYIKHGNSFREFEGRYIEVNDQNLGLDESILKDIFKQITIMKSYHNKLFIYLFIPISKSRTVDNSIMSKFIKILKLKLSKEYKFKRIGYLWVKELGQKTKLNEHYHFCLILDGNKVQSHTKLKSIVVDTWAEAGGQQYRKSGFKQIRPVGVIKNDIYRLKRDDIKMLDDLLYRLSYFAKNFTKINDGSRRFGSSNLTLE